MIHLHLDLHIELACRNHQMGPFLHHVVDVDYIMECVTREAPLQYFQRVGKAELAKLTVVFFENVVLTMNLASVSHRVADKSEMLLPTIVSDPRKAGAYFLSMIVPLVSHIFIRKNIKDMSCYGDDIYPTRVLLSAHQFFPRSSPPIPRKNNMSTC